LTIVPVFLFQLACVSQGQTVYIIFSKIHLSASVTPWLSTMPHSGVCLACGSRIFATSDAGACLASSSLQASDSFKRQRWVCMFALP